MKFRTIKSKALVHSKAVKKRAYNLETVGGVARSDCLNAFCACQKHQLELPVKGQFCLTTTNESQK